MKERLLALRPWIIRFVGYPMFFMFWFLLFVYVTFPYDRLKEAIISQVENPRTPSGAAAPPSNMQLSIGELGPTFLPGVRAKNVVLTLLPTKAGDHPTVMRMERVTAHVGLFSLLANTLNAEIGIQGMGGTIDTHIESALSGTRPGMRELRLRFDHVRVGELAPVASMVGLPMAGQLDGTVELHVPEGRVERSSGTAHITIDDLRIGDGHSQYQIPRFGGVTVEQIRAGNLEGQVTIRDGVATIDRLASRSTEFNFAMDGRVELATVLGQSSMNAGVRFQLTDAYRRKSEQAGRIMLVMDTVPDLQSARRPDGMLAFRCRGTFERGLTCPPDTRGGGGRPAGAAGGGAFPAPARRGFEP